MLRNKELRTIRREIQDYRKRLREISNLLSKEVEKVKSSMFSSQKLKPSKQTVASMREQITKLQGQKKSYEKEIDTLANKDKKGDMIEKSKELDNALTGKARSLKEAKEKQKGLEKKCRDIEKEIESHKNAKKSQIYVKIIDES